MKTIHATLIISTLFVLIIPISSKAFEMIYFSEVNGIVTLNGKPLKDVPVEQTAYVQNNKKTYRQTTTTDSYGHFHLEPIEDFSVLFIFMAQPVIEQHIWIHWQGKKYLAWHSKKMGIENNEELGGAPIRLECELTSPEQTYDDGFNLVTGICKIRGQST